MTSRSISFSSFLAAILFLSSLFSTAYSQDTLYIGSYNTDQIFRYNQSGNIIQPNPWLGPGGNSENTTGIQGEGIAVGAGFPTTGYSVASGGFGNVANPVFIANINAETIEVANASAGRFANPIVNSTFITGLNGVADIALSNDGQVLYVAQEHAGSITAYDALTGGVIATVTGIPDAHDIAISANGTVYVTAYAAGTSQSVGVITFNNNLTNEQTFIAPGTTVAPGVTLNHATGMVFDNAGNLWVANVYAPGGTVIGEPTNAEDFVSEFSSTGTLLRTIEANGSQLHTVFGMSLGADGNIYAASFNGSEITEINDSTGALTTFITLPAGDEPKYAIWGSDAVTYSAVPEPKAYAAMLLGGGHVAARFSPV